MIIGKLITVGFESSNSVFDNILRWESKMLIYEACYIHACEKKEPGKSLADLLDRSQDSKVYAAIFGIIFLIAIALLALIFFIFVLIKFLYLAFWFTLWPFFRTVIKNYLIGPVVSCVWKILIFIFG